MKEKIGLIFDLDGTLLNTLEDLTDATNYALRQFGCPERTVAEVRSFVGNGALRQVTLALPGREDDPDPQEVLAVYKPYYGAHCQIKTAPYEQIPEILEILQEQYVLAVVSNKPDAAVKALSEQHFPGLYAKGETPDCPRKPTPDMVLRAMEAMGVRKAIYIGDSEVDIRTAENAGVPCVSVLWGFRDKAVLEQAGGKWFCGEPARLPEVIAQAAATL